MDIVKFVEDIVANLVDKPEEVNIEHKSGEKTIAILIKVAKEDVGKIIGRQGAMITAMRTICKHIAVRQNKRVIISIIE